MAVTIIRNSREGEDAPEAPLHEDGTRYPYAMHFDGYKYLAFADTLEDLLDVLIPGYAVLDADEQIVERIKLALHVQVITQGLINADADPAVWNALTDEQRDILNGPRHTQPHGWGDPDDMGDVWEGPEEVPLVLVESAYAPHTNIDRPISGIADVYDPPNMIWLRPVDEWEFLKSLASVDYITLSEAADI